MGNKTISLNAPSSQSQPSFSKSLVPKNLRDLATLVLWVALGCGLGAALFFAAPVVIGIAAAAGSTFGLSGYVITKHVLSKEAKATADKTSSVANRALVPTSSSGKPSDSSTLLGPLLSGTSGSQALVPRSPSGKPSSSSALLSSSLPGTPDSQALVPRSPSGKPSSSSALLSSSLPGTPDSQALVPRSPSGKPSSSSALLSSSLPGTPDSLALVPRSSSGKPSSSLDLLRSPSPGTPGSPASGSLSSFINLSDDETDKGYLLESFVRNLGEGVLRDTTAETEEEKGEGESLSANSSKSSTPTSASSNVSEPEWPKNPDILREEPPVVQFSKFSSTSDLHGKGLDLISPPQQYKHAGNTCYIASILQFVNQTPAFRTRINNLVSNYESLPLLNLSEDDRKKFRIFKLVQKVLEIYSIGEECSSPTVEMSEVAGIRDELIDFVYSYLPKREREYKNQEDGGQFLQALLGLVLEPKDLLVVKKHSITEEISPEDFPKASPLLDGYKKYDFSERYIKSKTEEPTPMLLLSFPEKGSPKFEEMFKAAFYGNEETTYRGDDPEKKPYGITVKLPHLRSKLTSAPDELIIQMKRFGFDKRTYEAYKVQAPVQGIEEIMEVPPSYFEDGKGAIYRLDAIIYHRGDVTGGHYTAYTRKTMETAGGPGQYIFSDDMGPTTKAISSQRFLEAASTGYILKFTKISD